MIDQAPPEITPEVLAQNPALAFALSAFTFVVLLFLAGTITSWVFLAMRTKRGLPWLEIKAWSPRVWGLLDVVILAILVVACQIVFAAVGARMLNLDVSQAAENGIPLALATIANLGNLAAIGLGTAWIMLRFGVGPDHVGFRFSQFPRQVQIAVVAALAALPLVYLLMAAVSLGFESNYEHPLLEELKENATLGGYLLGFATAVFIAPLAEEFMFRVIIQGWLQSLPTSTLAVAIFGAQESPLNHFDPSPAAEPAANALPPIAAIDDYDPPTADSVVQAIPPIWPSVVTGILFGLAHWGYGLSFIPLIVLGIILGLLYRATQSIWPCVIVHMTLNGSSMAALGLGLLIEKAVGK
jgi:membrane protease YdiL (CAAX protease family)